MPAPVLEIAAPAFNEEDNVGPFVSAMETVLTGMQHEGLISGWRITLVDDGSTDATAQRVEAMAQRQPRVRLVRHEENRGYARAVNTALGACTGDWVLLTDTDLPIDPADLPDFFREAQRQHVDVLSAYRTERFRQEHRRYLMSLLYGWLVRWRHRLRLRDVNFACKLIRREVLGSVLPLSSTSLFVDPELLLRAQRSGFRIGQAPMAYRGRERGVSTLGGWRHVLATWKEVWRFRDW